VILANAAFLVGLWLRDGGVTGIRDVADLLTSLGRITGPLGTYLLLIQVLLLPGCGGLKRSLVSTG